MRLSVGVYSVRWLSSESRQGICLGTFLQPQREKSARLVNALSDLLLGITTF
jgi:hypothetical protein